MSGIGRVLAGVLLVGAVGGAAAFARESGSDPSSAPAVGLTAPPPQHIGAPGTVLYAAVPSPKLVALVVSARRSLPAPKPTPALRPVIAAPPPVATPAPEPAVTPTPVPAPPRALTAVPVAVQPATRAKGHGRALGHAKQHGPAADTAQVQVTPADPTPLDPGANGNGNAWGHSKDRGTPTAD